MTLTLEQKKVKAREILENVIIPTPLRIQEKLNPQLYASWFLEAVEEIEKAKKIMREAVVCFKLSGCLKCRDKMETF